MNGWVFFYFRFTLKVSREKSYYPGSDFLDLEILNKIKIGRV